METTTKSLERNLAIETAKVSRIEGQLESINDKLDNLLERIGNHQIDNINRYNQLSERITALEASKQQTKYLLSFVVVAMTALEFILKYVIK